MMKHDETIKVIEFIYLAKNISPTTRFPWKPKGSHSPPQQPFWGPGHVSDVAIIWPDLCFAVGGN